jgi:hypothetical protein
MLNRSLFLTKLVEVKQSLFVDYSDEYACAHKLWQEIVLDKEFSEKVRTCVSPWIIPLWNDNLGDVIDCIQFTRDYVVIATDGSQIYPDRHMGTACSLVNVGVVVAHYKQPRSTISFQSIPYIIMLEDNDAFHAVDLINCLRQEQELTYGYTVSSDCLSSGPMVLIDGSLIFWHLESTDVSLYKTFLPKYIALLEQYYQKKIPIAGYISCPKNKELVNLLRLKLCDFKPQKHDYVLGIDHVLDVDVMRFFLQPWQRTTVFKHTSRVVEQYPQHLKPQFFYLNVGEEIVRVEVPAWVAEDTTMLDRVVSCIVDQARKGNGYPVVLAEAHEQAVIKGLDRDFFYQSLQTIAHKENSVVAMSLKLAKKRRMNV